MDKREVFREAEALLHPFRIVVSVPHGAVLPEHLEGAVVIDLGSSLPIPTWPKPDEEGITVELSFGGRSFDCCFPWGCVSAVLTVDWGVNWKLFDTPQPAAKAPPKLSVVR